MISIAVKSLVSRENLLDRFAHIVSFQFKELLDALNLEVVNPWASMYGLRVIMYILLFACRIVYRAYE